MANRLRMASKGECDSVQNSFVCNTQDILAPARSDLFHRLSFARSAGLGADRLAWNSAVRGLFVGGLQRHRELGILAGSDGAVAAPFGRNTGVVLDGRSGVRAGGGLRIP